MARVARLTVLLVVAAPWAARAQIEGVTRVQVDAGFHQPVLTKTPFLLQQVPATFPPEAEQAHLQGNVKMVLTVAADVGSPGTELEFAL